MPVIFTFMLASFPSGLVIYWAWNNVLSLLQQYYIMQKNGAEIHLWKNLGTQKWQARLATVRNVDASKLKERIGAASASLPQVLGKILPVLPKPAGGKETGAAKSGPQPADGSDAGAGKGEAPMTREQALRTLGLELDATQSEIEAALEQTTQQQNGLNGSDHVIAAKIDEAREILRGRESS
jgi:hypothetical protein